MYVKFRGKIFHFQIFMANDFFVGSSMPNPGNVEPLERKFPKEFSTSEGFDFLKVRMAYAWSQ